MDENLNYENDYEDLEAPSADSQSDIVTCSSVEVPEGYFENVQAQLSFQSIALAIIIGFLVALCLFKGLNN